MKKTIFQIPEPHSVFPKHQMERHFIKISINFYTTSTQYTAEDIHEIGLSEVKRIRGEMQKIIDELGFEGSFDDFLLFLRTDEQFYAKSGRELMMIARDMAKRADEQLPRFFMTLPQKTLWGGSGTRCYCS